MNNQVVKILDHLKAINELLKSISGEDIEAVKITVDKEIGALYFYFNQAKPRVLKTSTVIKDIGSWIIADYGSKGILGLEILTTTPSYTH